MTEEENYGDYQDPVEPDEMDFPACCFCDVKYGSPQCQECPANDGIGEEEECED